MDPARCHEEIRLDEKLATLEIRLLAAFEAELERRRAQDAPWISAAWLVLFGLLLILCSRR